MVLRKSGRVGSRLFLKDPEFPIGSSGFFFLCLYVSFNVFSYLCEEYNILKDEIEKHFNANGSFFNTRYDGSR